MKKLKYKPGDIVLIEDLVFDVDGWEDFKGRAHRIEGLITDKDNINNYKFELFGLREENIIQKLTKDKNPEYFL